MFACGSVDPPASAAPLPSTLSKVVVALKPDKDPDAMIGAQELSNISQEGLVNPLRSSLPLSAAVILGGLANGSVDLAYLSATDMLNALKEQPLEHLLAGEIDGEDLLSELLGNTQGEALSIHR